MSQAAATIIVTQRERFGMTAESLDSLYSETETPFELVYVDGASPPPTAGYLREQAKERGFTLIRRERFLTPNQARNIGLAAATTPYVVFVDNDVLFTRGWLDALVRCADETGAAIVSPLTCHALPAHKTIHHAGGDYVDGSLSMEDFFACKAKRPFIEIMHGHNQKLEEQVGTLTRGETGFCEFHCVLSRRDLFDKIGPLDEEMLSTKEHIDFSMSARAAGEKVYFEPDSVITYVFPCRARPLEPAEWPLFALRWSDAYGRRTLDHFIKKWSLDAPPGYVQEKQLIYTWRRVQGILIPLARRLPLVSRSRFLTERIARLAIPVERQINRLMVARNDSRAGASA